VAGYLSLVAGYWSLVAGYWSLVAGHWSLVAGHWSLVDAHWWMGVGLMAADFWLRCPVFPSGNCQVFRHSGTPSELAFITTFDL
jgi:hypothetical protein